MPSRGSGLAAISIAMVLCMAIGVYGWLSLHHIDTEGFYYLFTLIAPTLGILWNNVKTSRMSDKVDTVDKNTNGSLTEKLEALPPKVAEKVKEVIEGSDN